MTESDQIGFLAGCAIGFNMDSDEIDVMLQKYGLDLDRDSLLDCQSALRDHVGVESWKNGIRAIRSRVREENSDWN